MASAGHPAHRLRMTDGAHLELSECLVDIPGHAQRSRHRRKFAHAGAGRGRRARSRPVSLAPHARQRVRRHPRASSKTSSPKRAVAYGVTTGFGKLSEVAIPPERLAELQVNLVRSHAAGVGDLLPEREVRAMMLLRANVHREGILRRAARPRRAARGDAERRALSADSGAGKRRRERRSRAARASRALADRRRRRSMRGDEAGPAADMLRARRPRAGHARRRRKGSR